MQPMTFRELPEFQRLVAISEEKYLEARTCIPRGHVILLQDPPASGKYPLLIALHGRHGNKESHLEQESYADLAHEFPSDFESSFDKATRLILE